MITPQDYIIGRLEGIKPAGSSPRKFTSDTELADFIYDALMSKKFRKWSVNPEYREHVRSAVELNVRKREPIKINLVFGGYKLWRLEEAPEADWAELFSIIYYAYWLKPVFDSYGPGVWFDFLSDDVIVELISNIPKADTDKYVETFRGLLKFVRPYFPLNFSVTLTRVLELYGSEKEFLDELDEKVALARVNGVKPLSQAEVGRINLNTRLKPGQDKDPQWRQNIHVILQTYMLVDKRRPYLRMPDKILAFTKAKPDAIPVGTTKSTMAKFWAGAGALKKTGDSYKEYVLSPSQIAKNQPQWADISISGLAGKNFNRIRIF